MSRKVIMCKGLPASGKSTWAKLQVEKHPGVYKRINKDELRLMLDNGKHSKGREDFILDVRNLMVHATISAGYTPIVDDTNLNPKHEETLRAIAKLYNADFEIQDFTDVSMEECIRRDRGRQNYVGEKVIRRMYHDYLAPKPEPIERDPNLPDAIIVDIDGTLAIKGDRDIYDGSKLHLDSINHPVADVVRRYWGLVQIIIVSGRDDKWLDATADWLNANWVPFHHMYMRKTGDKRDDAIVKRELFDAHIRGKYNIKFVLDDRMKVVQMWRSLGLSVFQVAEGDF